MRWRDWWVIPIAFLYALTYPVWWLLRLPKSRKAAWLERHATDDVEIALDGVARVQWFVHGIHTIASGYEAEHYFVIGSVVVHDSWDARLQRRLAARGLLPAEQISLGSYSGLEWFCWIWTTGIVLAAYVVLRIACSG